MIKLLNKWMDETFGSFPEWSELGHLKNIIGFKTRYGYIAAKAEQIHQGDIWFEPSSSSVLINVSSDPYNPIWQKI